MYYKDVYVSSEKLDADIIYKAKHNCKETIKLLELSRENFEKVRDVCEIMRLMYGYSRGFRDQLSIELNNKNIALTKTEIAEALEYIEMTTIDYPDRKYLIPTCQCESRISAVADFYKNTPKKDLSIEKEKYINELNQDLMDIAADLDYLEISKKEERYSQLKKLAGIKKERLANFEDEKRELEKELEESDSLLEEMEENIRKEKAAHLQKYPFLKETDKNPEM